jgi:hypothetical protein
VIGLALVSVPSWKTKQEALSRKVSASLDYAAALDWLLPLSAATLVFFQLYLPVRSGQINVNLADPVAILGGALLLITLGAKRQWPQWRVPHLNAHLVAMSLVVLAGFIIGLSRIGYTDWQGTKALGWLVLLAYGATGALIMHRAGERGLRMLLLTFIGSAVGIVAFWLFAILPGQAGLIGFPAGARPLEAFSQNRNAFGFLLLIALAGVGFVPGRAQAVIAGVLLLGIWFTGSRAIGGAALVLIAATYMMGVLSLQKLRQTVLLVGLVLATPFAPHMLLDLVATSMQSLKNIGAREASRSVAKLLVAKPHRIRLRRIQDFQTSA